MFLTKSEKIQFVTDALNGEFDEQKGRILLKTISAGEGSVRDAGLLCGFRYHAFSFYYENDFVNTKRFQRYREKIRDAVKVSIQAVCDCDDVENDLSHLTIACVLGYFDYMKEKREDAWVPSMFLGEYSQFYFCKPVMDSLIDLASGRVKLEPNNDYFYERALTQTAIEFISLKDCYVQNLCLENFLTQAVPNTPWDYCMILLFYFRWVAMGAGWTFASTKIQESAQLYKSTQVKDYKKDISDLQEQCRKLQSDLRKKDTEIQTLKNLPDEKKGQIEELKKKLLEADRQKTKLEKRIALLMEKYQNLKEQKVENSSEEIDVDLDYDITVLEDLNILFICNLKGDAGKRIQERFPKSRVMDTDYVTSDVIRSSDAVVFITPFTWHCDYNGIKNIAKAHDILFLHTQSYNVDRLEQLLKAYF